MRRLVWLSLVVVCISAMIFVGCTSPDTTAPPSVFEFRFATSQPEVMKELNAGTFFCDYVVEHSGGRIEITEYYGGSLASAEELLGLAKVGGADIVDLYPTPLYQDALPITCGILIGYSANLKDPQHFLNGLALDNPETAPIFREEVARQNVEWLTYYYSGKGVIVCNFLPAATLADFQGKKVGVFSAFPVFDAIGMSCVITAPDQVYEGLSRGVFDCAAHSLAVISMMKFYECSKAAFVFDHLGFAGGLVINRDSWNRLPPDLQQVCRDGAAAACEYSIEALQEQEAVSMQEFLDNGCEVNLSSPEDLDIYMALFFDSWAEGFTELCERTGVSSDDRDLIIEHCRDFCSIQ